MTDEKQGIIYKALSWVEKIGNKLPDPVSIFLILCAIVFVLSAAIANSGLAVIHPKDGSVVTVLNLLTIDGIREYLNSIVANFQNYPPLALVLVVIIGVGVAEKTGLMEAALKNTVVNLPNNLITFVVILLGIIANAAGDSGFIVLPPLAAVVYMSVGRHPLIGIFAAFGGVAAGFAANIIVNLADVLAASFTIPAAQIIDPGYVSSPAMNYYFILVSTFFLAFTGLLVTEKIVAPRFENVDYIKNEQDSSIALVSDIEKKGLRLAGMAFVAVVAVIVVLCMGQDAFLADPKTGSVLDVNAPLMKATIPIVTVVFLVPGLVYGIVTGRIKRDKDAVAMMGKSMGEMGPYIVLAFVASQFLALFTKSNLGIILAIKGAETLQHAGITGMGLIFCFIILSAFINLFIGSASAKWAILAPIFIPMFMILGFDPALTQMAYRIGDSVSNPISPLFPYFPIILGYMNKYKPNAGMGTIISNMLPYSVSFFVVWTILLFAFIMLGIPLGPN